MKPIYRHETTVDASQLATLIDTVRLYEPQGIELEFHRHFPFDEKEAGEVMTTLDSVLGSISNEHLTEGQEYLRSTLSVMHSKRKELFTHFTLWKNRLEKINITYLDSNPSADIVEQGDFDCLYVWYNPWSTLEGKMERLPLVNIEAEDGHLLVRYDNLELWEDTESVSSNLLKKAHIMQGALKYAIESALGLDSILL